MALPSQPLERMVEGSLVEVTRPMRELRQPAPARPQ